MGKPKSELQLSNKQKQQRIQAARNELWKRGKLHWKLFKYQRPIYDAVTNDEHGLFCVNCSRRYGKTTVALLIAMEQALQNKNHFIRFVSATQKDMRDIVDTVMSDIVYDAPEDVKPVWKNAESYYYFPTTGSRIYVSGANNGHEDDSRGRRMNLGIIDEASLIDRLDYLVTSVLYPQTLTTDGRIIMTFTPPETPDHPVKTFTDSCKAKDAYFERTIWDLVEANYISMEKVNEIANTFLRGRNDTGFQREYECAFVVEHERVIVPEWNDVLELPEDGDPITIGDTLISKPNTEHEYYDYYDKYVSMDMGTKHYTCILFGYYDFVNATLVIQDEWIGKGSDMTTTMIDDAVQNKEYELWGHNEPMLRIADNNNLQLLSDLNNEYGTIFMPTSKAVRGDNDKGNLHAMVNLLRLEVGNRALQVDPKCKFLIGCLRNGIWDKHREKWEESSTYGHYDGIAALMYLIKNLDKHNNPIPFGHNLDAEQQFVAPGTRRKKDNTDDYQWSDIFGLPDK